MDAKVKSHAEIAAEMLTIVKAQMPTINTDCGSNLSFLCKELARTMADTYVEVAGLIERYDIKPADLDKLLRSFGEMTMIPSKLAVRMRYWK